MPHAKKKPKQQQNSMIYILGGSINPAPPDNRFGQQSPNRGYDNRYHGYQPSPPMDTNTIFGTPNRQPSPGQSNQPWNNHPVFPNSQPSYPQQSNYPSAPFPAPPSFPNTNPYGQQPRPQQPFAFGHQPPTYIRTTNPSNQPGLFEQILYNKSGGKRNSGTQILPSNIIIYAISVCNVLFATITLLRWNRH